MAALLAEKVCHLPGGHFTVEDLHSIPEDGLRRELIDGSIVVSPSATPSHNTVARWIANILEDANPATDHVVSTDQSLTVNIFNELRPDLVVMRAEHLYRTPFPAAGTLLVGEVVSGSSVRWDTQHKRDLYAKAGIPSYWIIVPDPVENTIELAELVLDPRTRAYPTATDFTSTLFRTELPWPVEIDLPALAARLARYGTAARRSG